MQERLIKLLCTAILAIPTLPAIAESPLLNLDDFSYGGNLTSAESEFRRFTLTPNMINDMQRRDLGDVRVFDASNELMPALVRKKEGNIKTSRQTLAISPYRVSGVTKGYILDRSAKHKQSLKSLHLQWKRGHAPNVLSVRVEHSADKKKWKTLRDAETVNNFKFGGIAMNINVIDINNHTKRYIKLAFLNKKKAPALASVTAYNTNKKLLDNTWVSGGKLQPHEGMPNTYRFSVSKGVSPNFIKLSFGKLNSMLSGSLSTLTNIDGKLKRKLVVKNFDSYVVTRNNKVIKSVPIDVSQWQSSDWLITTHSTANISEDNLPSVTVAYPHYEVIFANDGGEPYTAVWGNSTAGKPMSGDIVKRIKASKLSWKDIAVVSPVNILNTASLTKLMESRQTSWLMLLIGLFVVITASIFGYRRYQSS